MNPQGSDRDEESPGVRGVRAVRGFLEEDVSLLPLGHGQSLAFRVDAPSGRYLLRVHSPGTTPVAPEFSTRQALESECMWLRALCDETDLVVPDPVRVPKGGYVSALPRPDGEGTIPCTLLRWVEGTHVEGKRTKGQAGKLGALLSALHTHARTWTPPPGFDRPQHRSDSWRSSLARTEDLIPLGIASPAEFDLLRDAVTIAEQELAPLEKIPERLGLIHADLHAQNYVFHGDSPRPIDFGRAGTGPWLYDLMECATHLAPDCRRTLVERYAQDHTIEDEDLRRMEGYFVATLIEVFGHNAPDPAEHDYLRRAIPSWAPYIRRFVDGTCFLFDL